MAAIVDKSVINAVKQALSNDKRLSYSDVQAIIRSTFDQGVITVQERDDLKTVLQLSKTMDDRARRAMQQFLDHIDKASAGVDAMAAASGNKQIGIKVPTADPGPFSRQHTDLGKFSHGCFDVAYKPLIGVLLVTLKVKYGFEDGISAGDQAQVKERLRRAVKVWDNSGVYLDSKDLVLNPIILIKFRLEEVGDGAHFTVDVEKDERREWVGSDLNVWAGTSESTFVHELGHVFGNYDEYNGSGFGGWIERRMYWHDNDHLTDTNALMNGGREFRVRYFDHFERYVNQEFSKINATYTAKLP